MMEKYINADIQLNSHHDTDQRDWSTSLQNVAFSTALIGQAVLILISLIDFKSKGSKAALVCYRLQL
jgi:uncharacterized protein Smg (DUF494 family)